MTAKESTSITRKDDQTQSLTKIESKSSKENKTERTSPSSQQQLLLLAKKFAIDGGLVAQEKQMPVADRALKKVQYDQIRKQKNIEAILIKAIAYCNDENIAEKANADWFSRFLSLAENVSNETMQGLWAKILAGEISQPGLFSLKSLITFQDMSIYDAKLFAKLCSISCHDKAKKNYYVLFGSSQKPSLLNIFNANRQANINLSQFGLPYSDILALAENHLIFNQETEMVFNNKEKTLSLTYNGIELTLNGKKSNAVLSYYKFTQIGVELARLINNSPDTNYLQNLKNTLGNHFTVSSKNE